MKAESTQPQPTAIAAAAECAAHGEEHASCGCHGHHHHHEPKAGAWIWPGLSLALLTSGVILNAVEAAWFANPFWKPGWFAAAFLPVGLPVIKEAAEAICEKDVFNEFTLMLIASIGAFCIGEYPEAVAVMLFYTIGETLQHKAVDKASRNISSLLDVRPEHTSVLRGGTYITASPKVVQPGEQIEVRPGERIPLDGTLLEPEALFDTSALTGESLPRTIRKNEEVLAGMIASGETVHVRVSRPYGQSALARILTLVKEASGRKAPAELFIRRFARVYTPCVIALSALIVTVPALAGVFSPSFQYVFADWLYRGLVFLVISCPCALVISVPLGYFAGIGTASRSGILFKGGNYLDAIARVNSIAFDKTGTLTTGKFHVNQVSVAQGTAESLLSLVMAAEAKSTHPIAQAIVSYAQTRGIRPVALDSMHEIPGHGVEAIAHGQHILVGSSRLLKEKGIEFPESSGLGMTTVVCAIDGRYAGCLSLSDTLKEDAPAAITRLKELGIADISLLSGDKKETVARYAHDLGITHAYGELLPEAKADYVEKASRQPGRSVAFVGDGMNDAPVLALSNVGIAMGGLGSDAAIESADVVIQTDQPSKVATAIRIGRATRRIVRENIVGAISVKALVLLAGAMGFASLWGAVFADVGVALLAVLNSIRILGKRF